MEFSGQFDDYNFEKANAAPAFELVPEDYLSGGLGFDPTNPAGAKRPFCVVFGVCTLLHCSAAPHIVPKAAQQKGLIFRTNTVSHVWSGTMGAAVFLTTRKVLCWRQRIWAVVWFQKWIVDEPWVYGIAWETKKKLQHAFAEQDWFEKLVPFRPLFPFRRLMHFFFLLFTVEN